MKSKSLRKYCSFCSRCKIKKNSSYGILDTFPDALNAGFCISSLDLDLLHVKGDLFFFFFSEKFSTKKGG